MEFTRESIFISALRSLFKVFAGVLGFGLAIVLIFIGIGALSNSVSVNDTSTLTVSPDAEWGQSLLPDSTPVVLRMNIEGVIGLKNLQDTKFHKMLVDSRNGALAKNRVKAILLYVNTPGGAATDSSSIYRMLKEYKEKFQVPIYAYVDGLCASGGMFISCAADKIYSSPNSVIGSVGVRMGPVFNFSSGMEKIGVSSLTLTEGKDKDALNPFRPWKSGEDDALKAVIADEYEHFVDVVTTNRKNLSKEKLINEYGANVFSAPKAKELGYIDTIVSGYDEALKALATEAGVAEKYQVILIEPHQSPLKELTENKWNLLRGKIEHVFPLGPNMTTELSGKLLYLYQP